MRHTLFYLSFLDFLRELYDAEKQIINAVPKIIQQATSEELKKGLSEHLKETETQVKRLEQIFKVLNAPIESKTCKGIKGIIEESEELLNKQTASVIKDCFIIIAAQKIEHYEIAAYGSACALVEHIKAVSEDKKEINEIYKLLKETLQEEVTADKNLTKIAEGKIFCKGVNEVLEEELKAKRV